MTKSFSKSVLSKFKQGLNEDRFLNLFQKSDVVASTES